MLFDVDGYRKIFISLLFSCYCELCKKYVTFSEKRQFYGCVNSPCMQGLPFQDLLPGLLVVIVVDFNNVGHILSSKVIITPPPPAAQTRLTVKPDKDSQRLSTNLNKYDTVILKLMVYAVYTIGR